MYIVSYRALYSTHFEGSVGKCFWHIVINRFKPWKTKQNISDRITHTSTSPITTHTHLDIFSLGLVIEHVGDVFGEDLFTSSTSVDAHHGHTDGPWSVSYSHLQIGIVRLQAHKLSMSWVSQSNIQSYTIIMYLHIFSLQHELYDVRDGLLNVVW